MLGCCEAGLGPTRCCFGTVFHPAETRCYYHRKLAHHWSWHRGKRSTPFELQKIGSDPVTRESGPEGPHPDLTSHNHHQRSRPSGQEAINLIEAS
jgi:hypothetical protein